MRYAFISGIPTSGKSYLAEKVSKDTGALHVDTDIWRKELCSDPETERWVNFYWNLNEKEYWQTTTCEQQWENLVKQSEAFWPTFIGKINEIQKGKVSAIIEGVNILPHLARKDLNFKGVYLLGESLESVLRRNREDPRWGKTEELQKMEAEAFWNCEKFMYEKCAKQYGYKTFSDPVDAEEELRNLLS